MPTQSVDPAHLPERQRVFTRIYDPPTQLTQKTPNQGKVSKELAVQSPLPPVPVPPPTPGAQARKFDSPFAAAAKAADGRAIHCGASQDRAGAEHAANFAAATSANPAAANGRLPSPSLSWLLKPRPLLPVDQRACRCRGTRYRRRFANSRTAGAPGLSGSDVELGRGAGLMCRLHRAAHGWTTK